MSEEDIELTGAGLATPQQQEDEVGLSQTNNNTTTNQQQQNSQKKLKSFMVFLALCLVGTITWAGIMTSKYTKEVNKHKIVYDDNVPIVIVGGGPAGTYLAWRLATADDSDYTNSTTDNSTKIHLYERTDHISGRVFSPIIGESLCSAASLDPKNFSNYPRTELGGMRIRDPIDSILVGVTEQLKIPTAPFYMNALTETKEELDTNPMFARNHLGEVKDFNSSIHQIPFKTTYQSFPGLEGIVYSPSYPGNTEPGILEPYDPCNGQANAESLTLPYGPQSQPYYTYSVQEMNHEYLGLTSDMAKFDDLISGYAFKNYDEGAASDEGVPKTLRPERTFSHYRRPLEGMAAIPHALHDAAVGTGHVVSQTNQEVTRVESLGNGEWSVTIVETATSSCTGITKVKEASVKKVIKTKRVVLALPAAALDRIQFITPKSDANLQRIVEELSSEVSHVPYMKLFVAWKDRWWETVKNLDTFSLTNMPVLDTTNPRTTDFTCGRFNNDVVNQVFAWFPGTQSRPSDRAPQCSLMGVLQAYIQPGKLPIYSSAAQVEEQDACTTDETCDACNPESNNKWFSKGISTRLRNLIVRDFSTLFREEVDGPDEIKYHIWERNDPVTRSDAIHLWKAGIKWWESYEKALEPAPNMHIIGEVFSHNQGWVEGALETAEHLVQEVLRMKRPAWLSRDDYCETMPFYENRKSESGLLGGYY